MVSNKNLDRYALISVYDKTNLNFICKTLNKYNIGIISTGSTHKKISGLGFKSHEISKLTNSKEILGGRVKTLHPKIYTSILHDRKKEDHYQTFKQIKFPKIDYIIVNLYPFEKFSSNNKNELTSIEMIDIGGVSLLRAGSKNFHSITSISSPKDYFKFNKNLEKNKGYTDYNFRKKMALKTFTLTAEYDTKIADWLSKKNNTKIPLRYGENPDQKAIFIKKNKNSIIDYQIQGKKISYNNILDINCGLDFLSEFSEPTAVIIKHNNACGVASSSKIKTALIKSINADKKSAFGGVVLVNKKINYEISKIFINKFFEVIVAPGFDKKSLTYLKNKKNLILIDSRNIINKEKFTSRSVRNGYLVQKLDIDKVSKKNFKIVSKNNKISKQEYDDILFSYKIVKHLKSNAIVLVKNKQTVGIGVGQMNRFDATKIAIMKYKDNFSSKNYICASDAFFPFTDSLKILFKNHCSCIVQPSGSINDEKVIKYVNINKKKLLFANKRVFKH